MVQLVMLLIELMIMMRWESVKSVWKKIKEIAPLKIEIQSLKNICETKRDSSCEHIDVSDPSFKSKGKMMMYCGMTKTMFDAVHDFVKPQAHK